MKPKKEQARVTLDEDEIVTILLAMRWAELDKTEECKKLVTKLEKHREKLTLKRIPLYHEILHD